MTIKILVLKSGEDVIADIKEMLTPDKKVIGYFMRRPCVVKLMPTAPLDSDDMDPDAEVKAEMKVRMHPWAPLAQEKEIPMTTDWVVSMITPVEKVTKMYKEDVLKAYGENNEESDQVTNLDNEADVGLTD